MKNNQLYVILIAIVFTAFTTSCSSTAPKSLLGTWKGVKSAPIDGTIKSVDQKNATAQNAGVTDTTKARKKGNAAVKDGQRARKKEDHSPEQVAKALAISEITFVDNKHAKLSYNRVKRDVRYKYKAKTRQLIMKDKEFGRITCDIETLDNNRLSIIEHLPIADFIVVYQKK